MMPPPPIPPPPPGAHPMPPNAHVYAHVYLLHFAHNIFVEEYGGPRQKTFDWFNSITRVRVFFKVRHTQYTNEPLQYPVPR